MRGAVWPLVAILIGWAPFVGAEEGSDPKTSLSAALELAEKDPKQAQATLKKLLTALSKKGALPDGDPELLGLFNRATTVARRLGVKSPATYRCTTHRSHGGALSFDVPIGTGWTENKNRGKADSVWQRADGDGAGLILTTYKMEADKTYQFPGGEKARGSDLKGLSALRFQYTKENMAEVVKSKAKIRSCSKKLKALGFEILGKSDEGQHERIRTWHVRSKNNKKLTLYFTAQERGPYEKGDPELEFILASLRETPRK